MTKIKVKLKRGDQVVVITGADKGKKGRVLAVYPQKNRVLVEGVRMIKRHTKPSSKNQQGGIIEREAPLDISNVKVI